MSNIHPKVQSILQRAGDPGGDRYTAESPLSVSADGERVVPHDHPDAAFVLVGKDGTLPQSLADDLNLTGGKKKKAKDEDAKEDSAKDGAPQTDAPRGLSIVSADGKTTAGIGASANAPADVSKG